MKINKSRGDANFKASPKYSKLKLSSAIAMVLPAFLGASQKAFAINNVDTIPKTTTAQGYGKMEAWATVKTPSGQEALHNGWHDQNNTRYYCLDPVKMTPGKYGTSSKAQYNGHEGKGAIKKVLITGYGANSAEWLNNKSGLKLTADQWEYATQVAVWVVGQSASKDVVWHDATVKKGYDYIMKTYPSADMQEDTSLKLKVVKNGKTSKTLQAETLQIGKHYDETVNVKATGVKLTQDGKAVTNKLKSNTDFTATLTDPNSGKGTITVSANKYTLDFPIYDPVSSNAQRGIAVIGVKKGTMTDTYNWGVTPPDTPPKTPPVKKVEGKAQFDLIKKDDDGKSVAEVKFDVYDETNGHKFIGTITTDKTGIAKSAELPFGKYQAIEKATSKNLQVDKTPVNIDLTEDNLKQNAKVTKEKGADSKEYDLYHLTVDGPINKPYNPELTSIATNLEDNSKYLQPIKGPQVINEHLHLSRLTGTKQYNIKSWLVDKATGQPVTIDGKQITAEKTMGSKEEDNDNGVEGNIDLQLKIPNASSLAGKDIVVYSSIARADKGQYQAIHQDINDKAETVHFSKPSIHTNAVNQETKSNSLQPTDKETVVDTVTYNELIPGKNYTIKGILMDKQSGKAVMNNGKNVEFSKTFTPNSANGKVDVPVTFDAHHYYGHDLVAYETLYYTDYWLAEHRDINDKSQTVHVRHPQLHTTLSYNTQKLVYAKENNVAEDVVRYTDLIPGVQYTVRGKLMDQVTGLPVVKDGVPIVATARFTPNTQNGTVSVTFKFNGKQYTGHTLVAFETLYDNGRKVVEHADLNDASQSIVMDHYKKTCPPLKPFKCNNCKPSSNVTIVNNNNNNLVNNNSSKNCPPTKEKVSQSPQAPKQETKTTPQVTNQTPAPQQPKEAARAVQAIEKAPVKPASPKQTAIQMSNNPETTESNETLPQTGNKDSSWNVIIGLGLISIPALAGVEYVRSKQNAGVK
ncbi:LPXTG cell wall anchor domain-containing protein (plasmid) [Lactobacillus sp. PV037]|uniref:VaFE repeat-containing surface-anchored protein n=1 Tax=Lactobacillus sp. PV037 TaxID=2594496 RepID=UPI00223EF9E4|nr:VaFE repeat-containing surface-anchored protein [Lactobacillus sp. PV037]QNQ82939.1 LPXTG cell wall anchor domain-containing protein [Lactobacillus sp. PV037]